MTKKLNAQHVVKDTSPSVYRLPGDGRKADSVCKERQRFIDKLAFYADSDGTNIFVGYEKLMTTLEITRDTVSRRFKELEELGFLETVKRHKYESGPAVRRLVLEVIVAKTQESEVRNSSQSPKLNGQPKSEIAVSKVRNSGIESPKSTDQKSEIHARRYHHSVPPQPPQPPVNSRGSGGDQTPGTIVDTDTTVKGLVKLLADKGLPCEFGKGERAELVQKIEDPAIGPDLVTKAVRCYISGARMLNSKTVKPWGNFILNFDDVWLPAAQEVRDRKELTKEDIDQITDNAARMHGEVWKKAEPEPEPDLDQLFGEPTTPEGEGE